MLKPNSSFKLSKSTKRLMAAHADPKYSNLIKRAFIQAELGSKIVVRTKKDREDKTE